VAGGVGVETLEGFGVCSGIKDGVGFGDGLIVGDGCTVGVEVVSGSDDWQPAAKAIGTSASIAASGTK
jgi:hypothetical protein